MMSVFLLLTSVIGMTVFSICCASGLTLLESYAWSVLASTVLSSTAFVPVGLRGSGQ